MTLNDDENAGGWGMRGLVCDGRNDLGTTLSMFVREEESGSKPFCFFHLLCHGECNRRFSDTCEAIEPNIRPIATVEEFSHSASKGNTCVHHAS
jgi:hypothetical protein